MGLFHETIKDIKTEIAQGKIAAALENTKKHIESEHHFGSDLIRLQRAISTYHEKLHQLAYMLHLNDRGESKRLSQEVEEQVVLIHALVKKLEQEEKIDIE